MFRTVFKRAAPGRYVVIFQPFMLGSTPGNRDQVTSLRIL